MAEEITGLSMEEVKRRREAGKGQGISRSITKPKWRIWKENIVTLFNFLNFMIAARLFLAGAYTNMLFLSIILLNIGIGIFQELKAKKLVDDLSILNRPKITAVREGRLVALTMEDLVEDDVLLLERGCQICNDAVVLSGRLEVNEALLTGESDPIGKKTGDTLLSGSSVISGRCYARVIHVGNENYATKLTAEVKREKQVESQLLTSMRKVTRFTSFLILPLGALLLFEAVFLRNDNFDTAIVSSAAALLGMLPKGLVLLISVSLANGVIRLSKQKILVQNLYSLETLAYVDTLCLDKTGTLTDGKIKVKEVIFAGDLCRGIVDRNQAEGWLRNYLAGTEDKNETMRALEECFPPEQSLTPTRRIPFSSERKWGAMGFADMGTIFVGAPERIGACPQQVAR